MFIPDPRSKFFHPISRIQGQKALGSESSLKYGYFLPKKLFKCSWKYDLWCWSRVRIISIPDPEAKGIQIPDPGAKEHRIPDPDPQHWKYCPGWLFCYDFTVVTGRETDDSRGKLGPRLRTLHLPAIGGHQRPYTAWCKYGTDLTEYQFYIKKRETSVNYPSHWGMGG